MLTITNEDNMVMMARYPDKYFDLAIVDPPYGIGISSNPVRQQHNKKQWDNNVPHANYFAELYRVSKNQIIWGGNYFNIEQSGVIIWYKGGSGNFKEGELAKTSFNTFKIYKYSRADAYINDCDNKIHPTQKPVKLYKWLLDKYATPGDKILDTHLGSGSIAIACHDYGFDLTACELDPDYFAAAMKRIENHTNQTKLFGGDQVA